MKVFSPPLSAISPTGISPAATALLSLALLAPAPPSSFSAPQEPATGTPSTPLKTTPQKEILPDYKALRSTIYTHLRELGVCRNTQSLESALKTIHSHVDAYRQALAQDKNLDAKEIAEALILIKSQVDPLANSCLSHPEVPSPALVTYLEECVIGFCGELLKRIDEVNHGDALQNNQATSPQNADYPGAYNRAESQKGLVFDVMLSALTIPGSESIAAVIEGLDANFRLAQKRPASSIYTAIASRVDGESLPRLRYATSRFEAIASDYSNLLQNLAGPAGNGDTLAISAAVSLPKTLLNDIGKAQDLSLITPHLADEMRTRVEAELLPPLKEQIINLWSRSFLSAELGGMITDVTRATHYSKPLSIERLGRSPDIVTSCVIERLSDWPGDRVHLGEVMMKSISAWSNQGLEPELISFQALTPLILIAPPPESKKFLVDIAREGLIDYQHHPALGSSVNRPQQIAVILGVLLLSDSAYCASESNTKYDPVLAYNLIRELKDKTGSIEEYRSVLTPAQFMYLELLRVSQDGEACASIAWAAKFSESGRTLLAGRADRIIKTVRDFIYLSQPPDTFSSTWDKGESMVVVPGPWHARCVHPPHPNRRVEFKRSLGWLFELIDLSLEAQTSSELKPRTEESLLNRIWMTHLALERRGDARQRPVLGGVDDKEVCGAVKIIRAQYGSSAVAGAVGPFAEIRSGIDSWLASRGEAPERALASAHEYAESSRRYINACFALKLIHRSTAAPQIAQTQPRNMWWLPPSITLPLEPEMAKWNGDTSGARQVLEICTQYDLISADPALKDLLNTKNTGELAEQLEKYVSRLRTDLHLLSSAIKETGRNK